MRVRENVLLFRNWGTVFVEGAGVQSVNEFGGMMRMNGVGVKGRRKLGIETSESGVSGRSQVMQGFVSHIRKGFILRKWRSLKGFSQVTDMVKCLFLDTHSSCRLARLEGGRPVSKHLKREGTVIKSYFGYYAPQSVHSESIHPYQSLRV